MEPATQQYDGIYNLIRDSYPKISAVHFAVNPDYQLSHKNAQSEVTLESKKSLADPELLHDVMHITLCKP